MTYNDNELRLLVDMGKIYTQVAASQLPEADVQKLAVAIGNLLDKITSDNSTEHADGTSIPKPIGISDEWYNNVCVKCNNYKNGNCMDSVTSKYPGKCDPILHYEIEKNKIKTS